MQFCADTETGQRVGVEETIINFRPSPNFKNMKKFLKSRMGDQPESSGHSPFSLISDSPESPPPNPPELLAVADIQPPLPLEPPPPNSPPLDNPPLPPDVVSPCSTSTTAISEDSNQQVETSVTEDKTVKIERTDDTVKTELTNDAEDETKTPRKKPICKDYIRGKCFRTGTCKYLHEYDLNQLKGIFTFCHNFQNSVCTRPNCKYVHASIFEESLFYRTGVLPKCLLEQKTATTPTAPNKFVPDVKDQNFLLQPPPPPPPVLPPVSESTTKGTPGSNSDNFAINIFKPPPQITVSVQQSTTVPIISCPPNTNSFPIESQGEQISPKQAMKRNWAEQDELNASSPSVPDTKAKRMNNNKCSSCKVMENRLYYATKKIEEMKKSTTLCQQNITKLELRHKTLLTMLLTVVTGCKSPVINANQGTNIAVQIKQLMQNPEPLTKKFNYDDNGKKAFQLSSQQLSQLQSPATNSCPPYQLSTNSVSTVQTEPTTVTLSNLNTSRQLTNLLSGW